MNAAVNTAARGRRERPFMRILTFTHYYLPGFKAGGPVRTVANLVDQLGQAFRFLVVTSDRDFGDAMAYPGVAQAGWVPNGGCQVWYSPPGLRRLVQLARLLRATPHDVLYLNSLFDPMFTLWPLVLQRLRVGLSKPVVLAPRGELSAGALGLKRTKKLLFLRVAKRLGLYRGLIWQASSAYEADDIRTWMGEAARIVVAANLPSTATEVTRLHSVRRQPGAPLQLVFLSRIAPKKNLDFALRVLQAVKVPVTFSIYGPPEDKAYVAHCHHLAAQLPGLIQVLWKGEVLPEQVPGILAAQDLFFFPTRGENYGHVIAEALSVGTPVLLSDTTPWRDLEAAGVGWDLPLEDESAFSERIEQCAALSAKDDALWRDRVRSYARARLDLEAIVEANRRLFLTAAGHPAQAEAQ